MFVHKEVLSPRKYKLPLVAKRPMKGLLSLLKSSMPYGNFNLTPSISAFARAAIRGDFNERVEI